MHIIRQFGQLVFAVLAVSMILGSAPIQAKEYTLLIKEGFGIDILGSGTFEWDADQTPPSSSAEFTVVLTFPGLGIFTFPFEGANAATIDFEEDHGECLNPDDPPEQKVCPSRVRAVTGSAPAVGDPSIELTLSDNQTRDDRLGNWQIGGIIGTTFITDANATIPAPAPALLLLIGLPALALIRRRLKRG